MNAYNYWRGLGRWIVLALSVAVAVGAENEGKSILLSGRMEMIHFHNFLDPIREGSNEKSRFYFNNIYLNLEGELTPKTDFIIEYQPLTSDLYLLGGFLTIAEALEGIGGNEAGTRQDIVDQIGDKIRKLDRASEKGSFERAQVNFYLTRSFSLRLGRVRNPFGFWDDYSLFRNLSALKTDPVSLGVALRRADLGVVAFGTLGNTSYELGILQGESTLTNKDSNNYKDAVFTLGRSWGALDLAGNVYLQDIGRDAEPSRALGVSYRYRATYDLSVLGEFISITNEDLDVSTRGFYIQGNYDLSEHWAEGLRWNLFFESYDSNMLNIDLDPDLDYRFAGTYLQISTGFSYAYKRNIDFGVNVLSGADEEGDRFYKAAFKVDVQF